MSGINRVISNVIVTGGTGVTGNALVRYLLKKNIKVTAIIRENSIREKYLPKENSNLDVFYCDLGQYELLNDTLKEHIIKHGGYDAFFHLAWEGSKGKEKVANRNNFKMQTINVAHAIDAVELCKSIGCGLFIMTGSQAEYGLRREAATEKDYKNPVNGYGMAKLCAEGMTRLLCEEYEIEHIWPILFSVYGPMDATESMIDVSIRESLEDKYLEYTPGEQLWNYLYSYDAAKALLLLAEHGQSGESYNVASANNRPLREYISDMYKVIAPKHSPAIGKKQYSGGVPYPLMADISKLKADTGFSEDYSFEEGISEILESVKHERNNTDE